VRRSVLLYNPAAGGGTGRAELARSVAAVFESAGEPVDLRPTRGPGDGADSVEELLGRSRATPPCVLVLGGDGTLNEAVTGALRAGALVEDGPGPLIGLLPAGTANVIARDLGLPRDPVEAARLVLRGGERAFDVGTCESSGGLRPFLLAAGVGIEAEAIAGVDDGLKRRLGPAAFAWAGLRAAGERERGLVVEAELADGRGLRRRGCASATCGNSRHYGGSFHLSRQARTDDGVLELVLLESTGLGALLRLGVATLLGEASSSSAASLHRVRAATIDAPLPVPVHVDAEPWGTTPVRIGVLRRALRLRVPA
jgi:YegS/Rv2252/BmrU family lipid kinase